jgi:quercetin dioxygenase-like cupin family protein
MVKAMNNVKTHDDKRRIYNPVQKDAATFLETSEETGGERTLIEIEAAPGGGTAPHYHKTYAEHFEVLRGVLEVRVGDDTHTLMPGHKAVAPINTLHRWHNATEEPVVFLVELRPGHSGFEKALTVAYGLAGDGLASANGLPKNPYHMTLLFEWGEGRLSASSPSSNRCSGCWQGGPEGRASTGRWKPGTAGRAQDNGRRPWRTG